MDYLYDPQARKDAIFLLTAVVFILLTNYIFLFGTGGKEDLVTRSDVFMLISIDAILGAIFYWAQSNVIDPKDNNV